MKTLYRIQFISLLIYIVGFVGSIFFYMIVHNIFGVQLPIWILALIVVLLCPILSASLRIRVWKKRTEILTKNELNHFGTKVFFSITYFEILFAIIGTAIVFQ